MSETEEPTTPDGPDPTEPAKPRGQFRRFGPLGVLASVVVLVLVAGLWLLHLGRDAEKQLTAVRGDITALRADVTANDPSAVKRDEADLQEHAHRARADTRDIVWRAGAKIPDLGVDLKVAGGLAEVADNLATRVLPPLSNTTLTLRPDELRGPDGNINLAKLTAAQTAVNNALPVLAQAQQQVAGLQQRVHLGQLADARTQFDQQLQDVSTSLTTASQALTLLPPMLGGSGPRNYLLVFQNLAEARGTGGLIGAYGILHTDNGSFTLTASGSDSDLQDAKNLMPAKVNLGPEFAARWQRDDPFLDWFRANLSPNWPSSAALFKAHYDQQMGGSLDGVIGIDPITLSYLLGPDSVHLSNGDTVAGPDVPTYTMQTLYNKYGEFSPLRKALLVELARDAFTELQHAPGSRLLAAVKQSAAEGRLQIWSSHPAEETVLASTPIGSELPAGPGSFAFFSVNNEGPKTDFFLDRSLSYAARACPASGEDLERQTTIEVKLTDRVPPGQNPIIGQDSVDKTAPYGRGHSEVSIYAAQGAEELTATLNGAPINIETQTESGHSVFVIEDLLEPVGVTQDIVLQLQEPVSPVSYSWRAQPLARPEVIQDTVQPCGNAG